MQIVYLPLRSKKYLQVGAPDSCAPKSAVMPVTPRFQLAQTDEYVLVTIRVPHIRVSAAETHVEVSLHLKLSLTRAVRSPRLYHMLHAHSTCLFCTRAHSGCRTMGLE
jgi:hypothetical protein